MSSMEDLEHRVEALSAEVQELKKQMEWQHAGRPMPADLKLHAGIYWGRIPPEAEYREGFCVVCAVKGEWVPLSWDTSRTDDRVGASCPACNPHRRAPTRDEIAAAGGPPLEASGQDIPPPQAPSPTYGPG